MNEMGSGENCDDEFECSDCDFKCTSEIDIIQHSATHQCPYEVNEDVLNSCPYGTGIEYNSNEGDTVNLRGKFSIEKEMVSCNNLADTPETYEPSSFEVISTNRLLHESETGSKKIKLEDIDMDIKQENCLDYSSHQINEYVNIHHDHQDQDPLGSMPFKNEHIHLRESMYSNISTEDGHLSGETIVDESESLSLERDPLSNDMSLTNSSKGLSPHKRPHDHKSSIEIEIDNTGIYIPPGWERKLYMRTTLCKGQLRYDCHYYTESGKQIRSKKYAYEYANKKHLANVDIEKLNFSVSQTTMKPDQPTLEVDLDNTGIYIPKGWQRKIYQNGQKKV
ncbi:unnamed protein product [Meganyctiphanes norvegica]|uniref:MBD domain-containing protein n=1 Tax=Meganyctiphanes norvegica TaxID=48144 RepID=A0AAV2R8R7_MEGNR